MFLPIYIPLTLHISRPTYDTDLYLPFPRFPLFYITPLLPYPNRLGSCFCLGPIRKQVLRSALIRTARFHSVLNSNHIVPPSSVSVVTI